MSLYFAPGGMDEDRVRAVVDELTAPHKSVQVHPGTPGWAWVDDDPERFGPASCNETGVTAVVSGRLCWSAADWRRAERLPYRGGLASRLILERYLDRGPADVAPYDGSAAVVIHDPRSGETHLWTDQFGYHPCFVYRIDDAAACIITTFPDAVLADPAATVTEDLVSMAEFLRAWRVTPPHTYFAEIKHPGPATHMTVDTRGNAVRREAYWVPFQDEFFPSMDAAVEELSAALRSAIGERTAIARRPLFFISGGADSRVLLFCADDPGKVTGLHLYERPSDELDVAKSLTELAGASFAAYQRDPDFYPRNLPDIVRWSGAMWSVEDSHYTGFADEVFSFEPDLVMTACTTDWVFKGYGLEKRHRTLLGRNLPFHAYTDDRVDAFLPNQAPPPPPELAAAVNERMSAWFEGVPARLSSPRDRLAAEDRRIRPACYTVSVSGPIMYRRYPYDTFLADSRLAACYSRSHPDWKLNHDLWGRAAARLCAGAGRVVNSNYGWRLDASTTEKAAVFALGWVRRRLRASTPEEQDDSRPSGGSWPDFGWYVRNSSTLRKLWQSATPEERDRMAHVLGEDPWRKDLPDLARDAPLTLRMFTLLSHWREVDARRRRAMEPAVRRSVGGTAS